MDQNLIKVLSENIDKDCIDMIISNCPKGAELSKIKVRPVLLKGNLLFQASEFKGKQVFHNNYSKEELLHKLSEWLTNYFKQVELRTQSKLVTILISKKGNATIKIKNKTDSQVKAELNLSHNREKSYVLPEGTPVPFLKDLGVMTEEGKVVKAKYDKYKQINRFLEFIEDIVPSLDIGRELTIIDFGCGKSYLTFAMYYYLQVLKGYDIRVIGLDLKKEVIEHCNVLAKRYNYDKLHFLVGDIASFEGVDKVDMVVSLHACDTATDYALYKAIRWNAEVILSVPCCQHELNQQMENDVLNPILHYGIIKERMAALATDALRAELLEAAGYKAQILEFIEMEHTPKNLLLRGVKKDQRSKLADKLKLELSEEKMLSYEKTREFLNVEPTLYQLLVNNQPLSSN
ncbi:MAG: Methyltransferase domain [Anaerocolumna sp.]|jgi:SAM-dependent methyltransferase|nr:Methyltransferase domain [Anaerocolumna sp.]